MSAVRIGSLQELLPGFYGIPEPAKNDPYSGNMDLVVAPGCAFTEKGDRLGYGGGYYDRFLEHLDRSLTTVCSLIYQRFVLPNLPVKKTDIPVDYLLTQEGIHDCRKMRG
jgi:5-formyltetrahydrofolate cyclo-ligase